MTDDDLQVFHSGDYVSFLKAHNAHDWDDLSPEEMEEAEALGLGMYHNLTYGLVGNFNFYAFISALCLPSTLKKKIGIGLGAELPLKLKKNNECHLYFNQIL